MQMIRFTPLTGAIGADVHGIDLSKPLPAASVEDIRNGLDEYQVLFFREQPILTEAQQLAMGECFGELELPPFRAEGNEDLVMTMDQSDPRGSQAANFHSDNTFRPRPPMGAILQAHVLPSRGGDTCFASMYAAYEGLSARMKAYLDGLDAYHSLAPTAARLATQGVRLALNLDDFPPVRHPVIGVHPRTGRKYLNVNNNWTTYIADVPYLEGATMLRFLLDHLKNPDFQVRLRWNVGDVAFWDNWAAQHHAVADYNERRVMRRVCLEAPAEASARVAKPRAAVNA